MLRTLQQLRSRAREEERAGGQQEKRAKRAKGERGEKREQRE
jgi:hypothetical protein